MWPDYRYRDNAMREAPAFVSSNQWPELRVVLDPLVPRDEAAFEYFDFLRTRASGIRILTRCDNPLPSRVGDYYVVVPDVPSASGDAAVRERVEAGQASRAMFSGIRNCSAAYSRASASGYDPNEARERHLDVEAAIALKADIYVTDNRFALSQQLTGNVFSCSPREAMAIVGLHQRLQDRLLINSGVFAETLDLTAAEYVEAWGLLPNTLRLFSLQTPEEAEAARWKDLVRVARVRLERCLRARDQILVRSIHPRVSFPFDGNDALVERVSLNISGMFDALARAIREGLSLPVRDDQCAFNKRDFKRVLPAGIKNLIGTPKNVALMKAVADLRNTIHHEALSHAAQGDSRGNVEENYVVLPASNAQDFRGWAGTLGATSRWIATDFDDFGLNLRAVPLVEDLMKQSVSLFEAIVAQVEWPGTINPELRVREDEPVEWWMHFTPTVTLVSALYGLELE
ncbi:UNVERIFIED_ORG: hypothetical protein ABIB13_002208 [Arthrobacter sp. UYEF2]